MVYSADVYSSGVNQGALADRGAFDAHARYLPGHIVLDGGAIYMCTAPVGDAPVLEDTFVRPDQAGWGLSSHGEVWQTSDFFAGAGPPQIASGRGLLTVGGDGPADGQLLGPSATRADAELLACFVLFRPTTAADLAIQAYLSATENGDASVLGGLTLSEDGATTLALSSTVAPNAAQNGTPEAGPTIADGAALWLRLRGLGLDYGLTVWADGDPEPTAPQVTLTATYAQPAGHPALALSGGTAGDQALVTYLGLRVLTVATAPGLDADHWAPLGAALPVPRPL